MLKRRKLKTDQEVILIYDIAVGFIQQSVKFKTYRSIIYNGISHEIPVFERKNSEITGLECFWVLPSDIEDEVRIEQMQRELIGLQLTVLEIAYQKGYQIPEKIKDREIHDMAIQNAEFRARLVEKLGYDPLDYSWVEKELAASDLEKSWFKFQREHRGSFDDNWDQTVENFRKEYYHQVSATQALALARKWKRYLIGAWNTIASHNPNIEDWKTAAQTFEKHHHEIEGRMREWTLRHKGNYPLVKVKEPIRFQHGPYFNECLERIPKLFMTPQCYHIRPGVVLQVVSYDPEFKYIRLDFTPDIRQKIKGNLSDNDPWQPLHVDYVVNVPPNEIETHLELLGSLE